MLRKATLAGTAALVLAQGCASWDQDHRDATVAGGVIGTGAGILIGSMTGSWVWGGLIGGSMGALTGYVIADSKQKEEQRVYATGDTRLRDEADREFQTAMQSKDPRSAEFHLKESIKFNPTPQAHNNLGIIQLQSGDKESARASFRKAILLDPGYDPALRNLERLGV